MFIPLNVNLGKVPRLPNGRHILSGGVQIYVKNGQKHRENGPAEINTRTGYQAWYRDGKKHREGEPAVLNADGSKEYWIEGKLLRKELIDGPGGPKA